MELEDLEKAYEDDQVEGVATAELFIGSISNVGHEQSLCGIQTLGLYVTAKIDRRVLFETQFALEALAGRAVVPSTGNKRDRLEVMQEIQRIVLCITDKGWTVDLFLDSRGFDVELISLFKTAGIDYLARNRDFQQGKLSPAQILQQICCGYDRSQAPPYNGNYPFAEYTDIGQHMHSIAKMLRCPFDQDQLVRKILKREPSSEALQLAKDHATVWYSFRDHADDHARALAAYDRPVTEVWANCEGFGLHLFNSKNKLADFFRV